jgi:hypothetical protein
MNQNADYVRCVETARKAIDTARDALNAILRQTESAAERRVWTERRQALGVAYTKCGEAMRYAQIDR